ncbi:MAG: hypothetical protein ACLQL2_00785 [Methylovirgula sp.]
MSRESLTHVSLVEAAAAEIRQRHKDLYSLTIFVDLPSAGRDRPTMIGGYVPDIFAIDTPETCRIIGEAKTAIDCETPRSRLQFIAFLTHLSRFPNGLFYLAVPWFYRMRAHTLIESAAQAAGAAAVKLQVI